MAAVEPPPGFASQVLAVTSRAPRPAWRRRLAAAREGLGRLTRRPLFPLEAAYVATVVAVLLFGTGPSPLRQMPARALDWLRGEESPAPLGAGAPILRDLEATGGRLADEAGGRARQWRGRLFQTAERRARAAWTGAREVGDGLAGVGHALLGHEGYELTPSLGRMGQGFDIFWGGLRGTGPAPPPERGPPSDPGREGPADASAGGRS
jgi:hypothetical protein